MFTDFESVITAWDVNDVYSAVMELQRATAAGRHAVGYIAYEAAPAFDAALVTQPPDSRLPLLWFGICREPRSVTPGSTHRSAASWRCTPWVAELSAADYRYQFNRVQQNITDGVTYQINFSFPLSAQFSGDVAACYRDMVIGQPGYGAWLHFDDIDILSSSPELFFERRGLRVRTKPMKGTRPRGVTRAADDVIAAALHASSKDRAENVMIVDLLRNDLGRIALPGTVSVPSLFDVEIYPTVLQMTSTVDALIADNVGLVELLTALFPCGSVTGAPKVKTMELIADLETRPRGVYCGTIGWLKPDGDMTFNVAIRTLSLFAMREAEYRVGSGLVADSDAAAEYDECLVKARVLTSTRRPRQLLESIRFQPDDGFFLLERHLVRLADSADYFGFTVDVDAVRRRLFAESANWRTPRKVRVLVDENGSTTIEDAEFDVQSVPSTVVIAAKPIDSGQKLLYHKTTERAVYDEAWSGRGDADDVILYNEHGQVTESTRANVAIERGGRWVTPPISCGLLAGTMRAEMLARGELIEGIITVDELRRAETAKLFNSVRGEFRVRVVASQSETTSHK